MWETTAERVVAFEEVRLSLESPALGGTSVGLEVLEVPAVVFGVSAVTVFDVSFVLGVDVGLTVFDGIALEVD